MIDSERKRKYMNKLKISEKKTILYSLLEYIDSVCRKNNIPYSLIGGSLIGAIREGKIIPWDDDVDIILTKKNYDRLISVLKKNPDQRYELLNAEINKTYSFPFAKIIDTKTFSQKEPSMKNEVSGYGVFLDIFYYANVSNSSIIRKTQFYLTRILNKACIEVDINYHNPSLMRKIVRTIKNAFRNIIGVKTIHKLLYRIPGKNHNTQYVTSCWPSYSYKQEVQLASDINAGYMDSQFGPVKAMIFKNYDNILKTTFGDYMTPPSADKRTSHDIDAYWKDDDEKKN